MYYIFFPIRTCSGNFFTGNNIIERVVVITADLSIILLVFLEIFTSKPYIYLEEYVKPDVKS